jgi:isohexenylglutaconyl-CoA hydratase
VKDYAHITLAHDDAIARLTLNRPERRNALTHPMMLELEDAFARVRDSDCRLLVMRGAGGHFCAGGDISAMADMPAAPAGGTADPLRAAYRKLGDALLMLNHLPQATVAIVEGSAVGGGLGIACCSDVVLVHESARFGMPEPRAGFIPSQIIPFVVRRIGEGTARDLAVTGRVIDGREAHRLGIGSHFCANTAELNRTLKAVSDDVLRLEPQALATVKRLVLSCAVADDKTVLDDAAEALVRLLRRPQASEGMRHFMAKTSPPWAMDKGAMDKGAKS